jgi:hypothetical protein
MGWICRSHRPAALALATRPGRGGGHPEVRFLGVLLLGVLLLGGLLACGGAPPALQPVPAPRTRAALVSGLCQRGACRCRDLHDHGDASAWEPTGAGRKRYELRLGPHDNELWVLVGDRVLYKGLERAEECFYLDLPPGEHRIRVRARSEHGFGVRLAIAEMSPEGPWWYDTFLLSCGSPGGVCDRDTLGAEVARIRAYPRQLRDPCGSTKIHGVTWQAERLADNQHPGDLQLDFVLHTYKFVPRHRPGAAECARAQH